MYNALKPEVQEPVPMTKDFKVSIQVLKYTILSLTEGYLLGTILA